MAPNSAQKRGRFALLVVVAAAVVGTILVGVGRNGEHLMAFAQTTTAQSQALPTDSVSFAAAQGYQPMTGKSEAAASLFKMLVALAVVVVCIYVGVFLLKKFMVKRHTGRGAGSLLEVIETAYIDPKKSLSLVRVANKSVLIGVTDNQISVLTELDPQHTLTIIQQSQQQHADGGFMSMLKSATDKFRGQGTKTD